MDRSGTSGSDDAKSVDQLKTNIEDDGETKEKTLSTAAQLTGACVVDFTCPQYDDVDKGAGGVKGELEILQLSEDLEDIPYPETCSESSQFDCGPATVARLEEKESDKDDDVGIWSSSSGCDSTKCRAPAEPSTTCCPHADKGDAKYEIVLLKPLIVTVAGAATSRPTVNDPPTISIETFQQRESEELKRNRELLKFAWINRVMGRLKEAGLDDDRCKRYAERIVVNGTRIKPKADPYVMLTLEDVYHKYILTNVASYQFLLIFSSHLKQDHKEYEKELRECQEEMESFCLQVFPPDPMEPDRRESTFWLCEVKCQDDVRNAVGEFFLRDKDARAKNSLHTVIVFFGHGSANGFALMDGTAMNLDDINLLVKAEWRSALHRKPEELPAQVEIIYTQCWGHLHDRLAIECDRFKVIALSTPETPSTYASTNPGERTVNDDLCDYTNNHLLPQMAELDERRKKLRDEADGNVVTAVIPQTEVTSLLQSYPP